MGYIIVWRPNNRDPFIQTNSNDFKEEFATYQKAKDFAELNLDNDFYSTYKIYQEVTS